MLEFRVFSHAHQVFNEMFERAFIRVYDMLVSSYPMVLNLINPRLVEHNPLGHEGSNGEHESKTWLRTRRW